MVHGLGSVLVCRGLWGLDGSCTLAIHLIASVADHALKRIIMIAPLIMSAMWKRLRNMMIIP